jgi:hypothetical protein
MTDNKKIEIIFNISELLEFINFPKSTKKTSENDNYLFVFDLGDVLIGSTETLGSNIWLNKNIKNKRDINTIHENMGYAYSLIKYEAVESNTIDIISKICQNNSSNVDYLVLTSRNIIYYSQTLKHLKDSGLGNIFIRPNMLNIKDSNDIIVKGLIDKDIANENKSYSLNYPKLDHVRYIDNICYCGNNNKGLVLEELISRAYEENPKKKYKYITVIDDSIDNINKVHNQFMNPMRKNIFKDTNTHAIHYSYMEINKRRYNEELLRIDDHKIKYMRNGIAYMNGKITLDYILSMKVLIIISLLWWIAFRFLGIITC